MRAQKKKKLKIGGKYKYCHFGTILCTERICMVFLWWKKIFRHLRTYQRTRMSSVKINKEKFNFYVFTILNFLLPQ